MWRKTFAAATSLALRQPCLSIAGRRHSSTNTTVSSAVNSMLLRSLKDHYLEVSKMVPPPKVSPPASFTILAGALDGNGPVLKRTFNDNEEINISVMRLANIIPAGNGNDNEDDDSINQLFLHVNVSKPGQQDSLHFLCGLYPDALGIHSVSMRPKAESSGILVVPSQYTGPVFDSICLGRKGLEWILSCFADIRDWVPGKDYLYKRYRENNKFFEFRGRSNKAGIFVEIAVYYGGARRGWIMVPASSNRSGWCLFSKELDRFLSGSNTVWVKGSTSNEDAGAGPGPTEGGGHFGKKSSKIRKQRKLRNFEISRAVSGHNVLKDATGGTVSSINGRPTRDFKFELTPANLALRASKSVGGKCMVTWSNHSSTYKPIHSGPKLVSGHDKVHSHKAIVSGPILSSGHDKAQFADLRGKAQDGHSFLRGVGACILHNQSTRVVGESSKPPMKSSVLSVLPEGLSVGLSPISSPDLSSEHLASNPSRELGALVTETPSALRCSSVTVLLDSGKDVFPMDTISDAEESHGIGI
ncbi:hypothetical protein CMV_020601 [Castanea mollissima]|uniref:Uncharacterized protein n=1 Tax=Castanea mollissima TaxID=60419 RepID=A0A8J4QL67_9ROSI|nr:hypothetical protein CMV_020601 [Castanea mollissima]